MTVRGGAVALVRRHTITAVAVDPCRQTTSRGQRVCSLEGSRRLRGCTCEVGLRAAGFVDRAAEGARRAGVTVLRLGAAAPQTPHLAVRPVHHLDELSHPEEEGCTAQTKDVGEIHRQKSPEIRHSHLSETSDLFKHQLLPFKV